MWRRAPALLSAGPLLTVGLLASAICLGGLLLSWRTPVDLSEAPGFAQAQAVLAEAQPDWILVWPPWAYPTLQHLPATPPAADAVPIEAPGRRKLRHIAMLSPPGASRPPELREAVLQSTRAFPGVEVHLFSYPQSATLLFDLYTDLPQASVQLRGPRDSLLCDRPRPQGGVQCPGQPSWNHVAPTTLRVEGRDWPAVWAHPVQGKDLLIDLGDQPLGHRIELRAALHDAATTLPGGAPVSILLAVEGRHRRNHLTRTLQRDNRGGVAALDLALPVPGDQGRVTLRIRTTRDARRHLGINLRILEDPSAREAP